MAAAGSASFFFVFISSTSRQSDKLADQHVERSGTPAVNDASPFTMAS